MESKKINGRALAREIQEQLKQQVAALSYVPRLHVVYVGNDPVIEQFIGIKQRVGERIGCEVIMHQFDETMTTDEVVDHIEQVARDHEHDAMIVQLPLPTHIDRVRVLDAVPSAMDVDVLGHESYQLFETQYEGSYNPPVPAAIMYALEHGVGLGIAELAHERVVVVGQGHLVGAPLCVMLDHAGVTYQVVDVDTPHPGEILRQATVIMSGAGVAGLITPDKISEGVVLIDAGTSEGAGGIVGDVDPRCYELSRAYTPVPGGIGPIAVTQLFVNVMMRS